MVDLATRMDADAREVEGFDPQPWLPAERLESLDDAEALPEDLARLLLPFRRRAPIRPIADIRVDRTVYQLLDPDGVELGQLLDDRIAVRRGGLVIARHREVTFEAGAASTLAVGPNACSCPSRKISS